MFLDNIVIHIFDWFWYEKIQKPLNFQQHKKLITIQIVVSIHLDWWFFVGFNTLKMFS